MEGLGAGRFAAAFNIVDFNPYLQKPGSVGHKCLDGAECSSHEAFLQELSLFELGWPLGY